ncbi:MAG: phosphatase PAP2 family protein, partial [Myxococcales bacterium]
GHLDPEGPLQIEVPIAIGAGLVFFGSEAFKSHIAPLRCRVCASNALDDGVRSALAWKDPTYARLASDVSLFLVAPALAVTSQIVASGAERRSAEAGANVFFVVEAVLISSLVNQATKFLVARERPFVHALREEEKAKLPHASDSNLSFYSGHTSATFTLAVAGGTVAELRGYRAAPVIWATGGALALVTGYLRIAADKHHFTDVLTGAVMGSALGFAVPFLFHGRTGRAPALASPVEVPGQTAPAFVPITYAGVF